MEAYLDNSATTRVHKEVAEYMLKLMCEDYGNPSSMHEKGLEAEKHVKKAAEKIAKILKVDSKELVFTSGGTESDNLAIIGCAKANQRKGRHIITTLIEHPAVLQAVKHLEEEGFEISYLPVDDEGIVSLETLKDAIRPDTIMVSIMHVNNEIGAIQPIQKIGKLIKEINPQILFHVDAVQGFGKVPLYPRKANVDLVSVSSHKIHGPKGVGFLYIKDKTKIQNIVFGGGQQKNIRSGTENVPGIAGMALAAELIMKEHEKEIERLYALKSYFQQKIAEIPEIKLNGPYLQDGAPHIISLSVKGIRSEVLLHALEEKHIYVSAGSACASNKPQVSKTLKAIGIAPEYIESTIRISLSCYTTKEEIDYTIAEMYDMIPVLRKYARH